MLLLAVEFSILTEVVIAYETVVPSSLVISLVSVVLIVVNSVEVSLDRILVDCPVMIDVEGVVTTVLETMEVKPPVEVGVVGVLKRLVNLVVGTVVGVLDEAIDVCTVVTTGVEVGAAVLDCVELPIKFNIGQSVLFKYECLNLNKLV